MKLTIYNNEPVHDVMEQLRFILMEFGVVLEEADRDKESVTYEFSSAQPLKEGEGED